MSACHVQNRHEKSSPVQAEGTYFSRLPVEEKKAFTSSFPLPPPHPPQPSLETSAADNRRRKGRGETLHWRHTLLNGGRGESGEDDGERDSQCRSTVLVSFFPTGPFLERVSVEKAEQTVVLTKKCEIAHHISIIQESHKASES